MLIDKKHLMDRMAHYLSIPSPAGYTYKALDAVKADFEALGYAVTATNKGALIVEIPGKSTDEKVMIAAHIDTLGGIVKAITPDGRLRYHKLGGGSYHATEGENVTLFTTDDKVFRGSMIPKQASTHIYGEVARTVGRDEHNVFVRLDERVKNAEDVRALGIAVGDILAFDTRFEVTASDFIKSRYLDDKSCVAMLVEIARYLKAQSEEPAYTTYFYISNYEEVSHGISVVDSGVTEILALDIGTVGGDQTSDEFSVCIAAKDNKGPYDYAFRKLLTQLCKTHDIPHKVDVYNRYGSDASAAVHHGFDVRHACIGPGVDATHHYERTHYESIEATTQLIYRYMMRG
ncbi:M42 family metallopeptidase [Fusibacter sp. JL298sf-3]